MPWRPDEARWATQSPLATREPGARLYELYLERTAVLRAEPPGPDWDGTVTYREK